jgi:hypothetical protein
VSHRQQAMRIAINTGVLASSVRKAGARGLVFRISVSKCRLDRDLGGHRRHLAGNLRAGITVTSTFQRGLWQCVD